MSENLTVKYIEKLKKDGPDPAFEFVYDKCSKKIELRNKYKLSDWFDSDWWHCVDPANHTFGVTQNTFIKFYKFNLKFFESNFEKKLTNLWGLLYSISNNKISEHFKLGLCKDILPNLTIDLDDVDKQQPDKKGGRKMEDKLIFEEAKDSLPQEYKNALEDYLLGFSHEEISGMRNISVALSKVRRWKAILMFRKYGAK